MEPAVVDVNDSMLAACRGTVSESARAIVNHASRRGVIGAFHLRLCKRAVAASAARAAGSAQSVAAAGTARHGKPVGLHKLAAELVDATDAIRTQAC